MLLYQKIGARIVDDFHRLFIVKNTDGFLTDNCVQSHLEEALKVRIIVGTQLTLRVHFELQYKEHIEERFLYVCDNTDAILPDIKDNAKVTDFAISDMFPMMPDKQILRKLPVEVLEVLFEQQGVRKISLGDQHSLIERITRDIQVSLSNSAETFIQRIASCSIDWTHVHETCSQFSSIIADAAQAKVYGAIESNLDTVNAKFQDWLCDNYFSTLNANHLLRPQSVNKVLPFINSSHTHSDKVALVVIDGFSYWQYQILSRYLHQMGIQPQENTTLAWLPSITMLSRQAIFRGDFPVNDYKQTPENERKLWQSFWQRNGFSTYETQYLYDTDEFAINSSVTRLAFVTVEMDEKMHSSSDYCDLYSLTENWCPRIIEKIQTLLRNGYTIYLTTDHGSVLSHGWRTLTAEEKVFLYKDGSRGKRHLIYNNPSEQELFFAKYKNEVPMLKHGEWMTVQNNSCFAREGNIEITHGGSHWMEVVIPFVTIVK